MARCATCGNEYERCFDVVMDDMRLSFDCFECAIDRLAPTCSRCGCRVIGHGVDVGETVYCCEHCARGTGRTLSGA